jgi:hypothetical protein
LLDRKDEPVAEWSQAIAVYRELFRRLTYPVEGLQPGSYRLEMQLSTEREDIPPQDVLPVEPMERVVNLILRGGGG